jgi:hypothetical protein
VEDLTVRCSKLNFRADATDAADEDRSSALIRRIG